MEFTAIIAGAPVKGTWKWSGQEGPANGKSRIIEARINDRTYTLEVMAVEPQGYWIQWNNQSLDVTIVENAEGTVVTMAGRRIVVALGDGRRQGPRNTAATTGRHDGAAELRAPMPGKVVRTLVSEGDTVEANQGIVVVEAMKMQNEIKAPKAGIVKSLSARAGAPVNAGDILAVVE